MTIISTLNKYILKKIIPVYFINVIILTFILILDKLFELSDMVIEKSVPIFMVGKLLFYSLPSLLALTFPMAVLITFILVFSKLAANNEIIACYNSGIHPLKLFKMPLIFILLLTGFLIYFNSFVLPNSNYQAKKIYTEIHAKQPSANIVENRFIDNIDGYRIYIEEMNYSEGILKNVIIYDYKNKQNIKTIIADKGKLNIYNDKNILSFELKNGSIFKYNQKDKTRLLKFNFNKQTINIQYAKDRSIHTTKGDREYTNPEIKKKLKKIKSNVSNIIKNEKKYKKKLENKEKTDKNIKLIKQKYKNLKKNMSRYLDKINELLVEYHKKYALAFSAFFFALIAFPLGIITNKRKKGYAWGISLFLFLIYWISLLAGETLSDRGILSPFFSMWMANIFLAIIGLYLNILIIKGHFYFNFFIFKLIKNKVLKYVKYFKNR